MGVGDTAAATGPAGEPVALRPAEHAVVRVRTPTAKRHTGRTAAGILPMAGPRCSPRQHEQVKTREVLDMVGSVAPVSTTPIEDRWFEDYVPGPVFW